MRRVCGTLHLTCGLGAGVGRRRDESDAIFSTSLIWKEAAKCSLAARRDGAYGGDLPVSPAPTVISIGRDGAANTKTVVVRSLFDLRPT